MTIEKLPAVKPVVVEIKQELVAFGIGNVEAEKITAILEGIEENTATAQDVIKLKNVNEVLENDRFGRNIRQITRSNRSMLNVQEQANSIVSRLDSILIPKTLEYFCKLPQWTALQVAALLTGFDPSFIEARDWFILSQASSMQFNNPKYNECNRLYFLLQFDIHCKKVQAELSDGTFYYEGEYLINTPDVIQWAKEKNFPLPEGTIELVRKYHGTSTDWESKYKELEEKNRELTENITELEARLTPETIQHSQKKGLYQTIAMLGLVIFEKHTHEETGKLFNANSLWHQAELIIGELDIKLYDNFEILCQETFTQNLKPVRKMLGYSETEVNKPKQNK